MEFEEVSVRSDCQLYTSALTHNHVDSLACGPNVPASFAVCGVCSFKQFAPVPFVRSPVHPFICVSILFGPAFTRQHNTHTVAPSCLPPHRDLSSSAPHTSTTWERTSTTRPRSNVSRRGPIGCFGGPPRVPPVPQDRGVARVTRKRTTTTRPSSRSSTLVPRGVARCYAMRRWTMSKYPTTEPYTPYSACRCR